MKFTLLVSSIILSASHLFFFLRAYLLRNKNFKQGKWDKISRNISVIFLPFTAILGTIVLDSLFIIIFWIPIVLIVWSNFNKKWVIRNPYILPIINTVITLVIMNIAIGAMHVS